jgi:methyltransferase
MCALGRYWTTRIIVVPNAPLIRRGPYRFMRHPNYALVVAEIAVLPLVFGAWPLSLLFSGLNAAVLAVRLRSENAMLSARA